MKRRGGRKKGEGGRGGGALTCSARMQNLIKFVSLIFSWNKKHRGDVFTQSRHPRVWRLGSGRRLFLFRRTVWPDQPSGVSATCCLAQKHNFIHNWKRLELKEVFFLSFLHSFVAAPRECCRQGRIHRDQENERDLRVDWEDFEKTQTRPRHFGGFEREVCFLWDWDKKEEKRRDHCRVAP